MQPLSGNITLNWFFSESQDLKLWDFTTFKHHAISAFKVFSSKPKEESDRFCASTGPTFADLINIWWFWRLWGKKQLHSTGFPCFLKLLMFLLFLVGVKSIGATRFQVDDCIAQFTIRFASVGRIFRNPQWVLWIAEPIFLQCWFRMRFWHY